MSDLPPLSINRPPNLGVQSRGKLRPWGANTSLTGHSPEHNKYSTIDVYLSARDSCLPAWTGSMWNPVDCLLGPLLHIPGDCRMLPMLQGQPTTPSVFWFMGLSAGTPVSQIRDCRMQPLLPGQAHSSSPETFQCKRSSQPTRTI